MSQTGYTPISLYYSTTASAAPSAGNLVAGELAINTLDEKLYFKNSAGTVKVIASTASVGVTSVAATVPSFLSVSGSPITSSGTLAFTYSGTALPVANGGTGLTFLTASYVPYGNGTGAYVSSPNFQYDGTVLRVGTSGLLGGLTNPTIASTGGTNNYIQSYIYNSTNGTSASSDWVAYANNSTDAHGWADLGFTSASYADTIYTVTGPNEAYLLGSAPTGAGATGNLVYATDNTGSANAHQWYVGGFTQAKGAWKMQLTSAGLQLANALPVASGGTGLATTPANGALDIGNGTGFTRTTLTAGAGVTITNGAGSITIAASGGGGSLTGVTQSASPYLTALGYQAGSATTGISSTFLGYQAGQSNNSGVSNTAIGYLALNANTTGGYNVAIGDKALRFGTANTSNIGIGYQAGFFATSSYNVFIGHSAGEQVTTGAGNSFVGYLAGAGVTTGQSNTVFGYTSGQSIVGNSNNTIVGASSLVSATGTNNTAVGASTGSTLTSGGTNTLIGYGADVSSATISNTITLGNSSITTLRCQVTSITALSDARDKTDVAPLPYGLSFINNLNPVSFTWNTRDGGKVGVKSSGFIAQELKATQEAFNASETLNLVFDDNPEKLEATYGHLLPVMVKAIQELSAKVEQLEKQLKLA